jgi:amidohydrolase
MTELQEMLWRELSRLDMLEPDLIKLRRRLHMNPELRFEERETAETLMDLHRPMELSIRPGHAETGLLVDLCGGNPGPTVALRADMDALPIQDAKDVAYGSRRAGIMHACGHDAHMTMAYGVLRTLEPLRQHLKGTLRVIFQPGEEVPAGGESGAREIIQSGALADPEVEAVFGMHCWPALPAGIVGLQPGVTMAAADSFLAEIHGESAHAGEPHNGKDAIFAASTLVVHFKTLLGREVRPGEPATINVGMFRGGETQSIVADRVELAGTLRTLGGDPRERLIRRMFEVADGVSRESGCEVNLDISDSFPPVDNDPSLYERAEKSLTETIGSDRLRVLQEIPMTADDFAFYLDSVPGLYLKIGCAPPDGRAYPLHHPRFDVDESALRTGVEALATVMVAEMEARSGSEAENT